MGRWPCSPSSPALVLAACSGVPTNTNPEVIGPVVGGVAPSSASVVTPAPGADERQIVLGFLDENVSEDAHHTSARSFLTADASKKWVDTTTVVATNINTGVANLQTNSVNVTANKVGTVDARGIYTPVTEGAGSTPISLTFGLIQVAGQWRINTLRQRPDRRSDPVRQRLQAAPDLLLRPEPAPAAARPALQPADRPDAVQLAARAAQRRTAGRVAVGLHQRPARSDRPRGGRLRPVHDRHRSARARRSWTRPTRARLAVQLAYTFAIDFSAPPVTLTDSSKPVSIPQVSQPFSDEQLPVVLRRRRSRRPCTTCATATCTATAAPRPPARPGTAGEVDLDRRRAARERR